MAFRFLGNKSRLLPSIVEAVRERVEPGRRSRVADLFTGTASVAVALAGEGYSVTANDLLLSCATHARAQLLSPGPPSFGDVASGEGRLFPTEAGYLATLAELNGLPPEDGFFLREYSPEGEPANEVPPRHYFSAENARRIDAIRSRIRTWREDGHLSTVEHALLLHDLMLAANRIANTAGTYGHFLSHTSASSEQALELRPSQFGRGGPEHTVLNKDAEDAAVGVKADLVYLDPPYTKRQYAAYYHVLETLAHEDEPELVGKSGLRPWQDRASDFCYKSRAASALARLLDRIDAPHILLSYSEDGHIPHEQILDLLAERGTVSWEAADLPRYHSHGHLDASSLKERLYSVAAPRPAPVHASRPTPRPTHSVLPADCV